MPQAARFLDVSTHGGFISGPCCPDVLVVGSRAARVGDQHVCPMVDGGSPHVGGPIVRGVRDVKFGGQFASRCTDKALCKGPTDTIMTGALDVFIDGAVLDFRAAAAGGNTLVAVDPSSKRIYIESFLEYSGPGASEAYAQMAKSQIEDTWSHTCTRNGVTYQVDVGVHTSVNNSGTPTPGYDSINIDPATKRDTQPLFGTNPGHQDPGNLDHPDDRVPAHEYGHSLGLDDEYHDTPTGSVPNDPNKKNNIMAQTWPDADGNPPHPHQDQYDKVLKNHGW